MPVCIYIYIDIDIDIDIDIYIYISVCVCVREVCGGSAAATPAGQVEPHQSSVSASLTGHAGPMVSVVRLPTRSRA